MGETQTILDETATIITNAINAQQAKATASLNEADGFLDKLANNMLFAPTDIENVDFGSIDINPVAIGAIPPTEPRARINAIKASIPTLPADFTASVTDRAIQETPDENFTAPTINFPTAPTFVEEVKPSKQETTLPNAATKPIPTIPGDLTVSDQNVPNIPSISLPDWGETIPTLSIALPSTTLAYVEPVYTSALKTELASNLLSKIQSGGTGLNATIEGNIYNRDVERLAQKLSDDIDATLDRFAGRGFTMPPGTVAAQVQELQINHTNERSNQSRDVAIQQANIADVNTRFFLQIGLSWEELLINQANNIANRALEAEKSVVEFSISLFNSKIAKFNVELAKYQAKDIEVQSNLRIQQLKLSQYEAELRGVEADATKDSVSIENYKAKLTAHDAQTRLYEAETAAINSALNIERARIEIFREDINDYVARIGAKKNEYDLYLAEVQGESAKVDLQRSNVETYAARVNAVKVANDTVQEQVRSDIAVEELNLKSHITNVDIWKEKSQLAIQEMNIERDFFSESNRVYSEVVRMSIANASLVLEAAVRREQIEQKQLEVSLQKGVAEMNASIEQARIRHLRSGTVAQGYVALATILNGVVQSMIQLASQGIATLTGTES